MQGAGDLDELLFGDRKLGDGRVRVERRAQPFEHRPAARPHRPAIDAAAA